MSTDSTMTDEQLIKQNIQARAGVTAALPSLLGLIADLAMNQSSAMTKFTGMNPRHVTSYKPQVGYVWANPSRLVQTANPVEMSQLLDSLDDPSSTYCNFMDEYRGTHKHIDDALYGLTSKMVSATENVSAQGQICATNQMDWMELINLFRGHSDGNIIGHLFTPGYAFQIESESKRRGLDGRVAKTGARLNIDKGRIWASRTGLEGDGIDWEKDGHILHSASMAHKPGEDLNLVIAANAHGLPTHREAIIEMENENLMNTLHGIQAIQESANNIATFHKLEK